MFMAGFLVFIFLMMAIDLGLFGKSEKPVSLKEASIMSGVWVALALGFYMLILHYGDMLHSVNDMARLKEINANHLHNLKLTGNFAADLQVYRTNLGLEFLTGYVVEYALSIDNIFVMVLIFSAFSVDKRYYHKVLLWGIIGAVLMRFLFIFLGSALITEFHWILYIFGAFLVYTGLMMFINRNKEDKIDPDKHPVVKFASRFFAVHQHFVGGKFFVKMDGKKMITPLFLVLLIIEATDLVFAVDSIPAIFSITKDPYIVFFSNIFAILGLRSMFFLLINIIDKFHYLKVGLAALLAFIGIKMLVSHYAEQIGLTTGRSLLIIVAILAISIVASLIFPKDKRTKA
jgi:tellurite resistance protein TerC